MEKVSIVKCDSYNYQLVERKVFIKKGGNILSNEKEKHTDDIEMVVLKITNNSLELNFIKNLLEENSIPYILKDYGAGGYMRIATGSSLCGTDILVEKLTFEKAKEILDNFMYNE